jgi:hypothetical protein
MIPPTQDELRVRCDPVLGKVRDRLLAIGGTAVVLETASPSAVRRLHTAGQLYAGDGAVTIPLDSQSSSSNLARLHLLCPDSVQVAIGYARGRDGCWRPHVWGVLDGVTVIETAPRRDWYFGYLLDPDETARFCWWEGFRGDPRPDPASIPAAVYTGRVRWALEYGEQLLKK